MGTEAMKMSEITVATKPMIEEVFDGAAARYDREGPNVFSGWGERLVDLLGLVGGERVLDVATGKGAVLIPAAQNVGKFGRVVGVDLSHAMLQQAEIAAQEAAIENFGLYKMDAEHLEFRDGIFDVVTCALSIFFFPSQNIALAEMKRVLHSRGRLGVSVFGTTPPPFDPAWRIFADQMRAYNAAVRTPGRVSYTPEEFEGLLIRAGFLEPQVRSEQSEVVFSSLADWWAFQFTLGNRAALTRMSEVALAKFKGEYFARLEPLLSENELHLGVSLVYAIARCP
jgi:ubiquinone/menaquinone biosynthesis C-methylase UbiE